ncbi:GHKL domain-containing protein [Clostridium sp. P21]|uniref:GHKL domain-containing protein n=1 Tax=Clostridium muellerianum TaxID=2716538 RepID=A0A7Y0EM51_9CLOT|nr:GHKL domain-containing protein [Clostridium muellerianum]NMM65996.1 GHKL domain-containing protein [Clostridium muellerianum]
MIIKKFTISMFLGELIFPPLPISILCCAAVYFLGRDKHNLREIKRYFFISFITGMILRTGSYILVLPLLSIIVILELKNSKNINRTIKNLIAIFTIYFLAVIPIPFWGTSFYEKNIISIKHYTAELAVSLIIVFLTCKIINIIYYKTINLKKLSSLQIRNRMILSICIPIAISIQLLYPFVDLTKDNAISFVIDSFIPLMIPLVSIILILIVIYNYDKSVKSEVLLKREIEEKYQIEEYAHMVEEMYSQTRRFKHDYINMLTPLKEYIDNDDMEKLKEFFYDNVIDMDKDIKWTNSNIDKLRYIRITALKALLSTKLIKALSMNIDIKVEIVENISEVPMNIMDLCRIMGILMNNASEAADECEYPKLSLCIVNKEEYVVIAVQNNFSGEKPVIHKIYKEGFSTKGSGRGLGLYTVKNIIETKYDNVFINTSIEDNMFIQELWIKNIKLGI